MTRVAAVGAVLLVTIAVACHRPLLSWARARGLLGSRHVRPSPLPSDTKVLVVALDARSPAKYRPNAKRDDAVMREARRRVGIAEDEEGDNRGAEVDAYLRTCRARTGSPWCAAFVAHTIHTAYPKSRWVPSASCQETYRWAKRNRLTVPEPTPATVVLFPDESGRFHHIGFVVGVDKAHGTITTIEGNSNDQGSPDGTEVVLQDRPLKAGYVFVRIV